MTIRLSAILSIGLAALTQPSAAQISASGSPPSFSQTLQVDVPTVVMPPVDNQALLAADALLPANEQNKFATRLDVSLNLQNSGVWTELPNGDRLWLLRISSPGAHSLGLLYDEWHIPKGGQLFIYNDDHSMTIGAYTSLSNSVSGKNVTRPVFGDAVTIEYLEPSAIRGQSVLSIFVVCHAYRPLFDALTPLADFGDAAACAVNINCPQGASLQDIKHGVVLLLVGGNGWCSGALVNNTAFDGTPYVLTARHCMYPPEGGYDSPEFWTAYFNYESPQCVPNANGPTWHTIEGAIPRSDFVDTDMALVELSSRVPPAFSPYFFGWDNRSSSWTGSYNIAHPMGDVKKLAIDNQTITGEGVWWRVETWDLGISQRGSSGSPLIDDALRVRGVTSSVAFSSTCETPGFVRFGSIRWSWYTGDPSEQLSNWLDPLGVAIDTICEGQYILDAEDNDVCPGTFILSLPYLDIGSTGGSNDDYAQCGFGNSPDVVYTLAPLTCQTVVTASLCGSSYDTAIDVLMGGSCPGTTLVTCGDDECSGGASYQSEVTFLAEAGVAYYIIVQGYNNDSGVYRLSVTGTATLPNDECPGTPISSLPYSDSGDLNCASSQYDMSLPCVYEINASEVFYQLNLPTCQTVTASLCGSDFDTGLEVRSDGACPGDVQVACNDNSCGDQSEVTFFAERNKTYYVIVSGTGGISRVGANWVINVTGIPSPPIANDDCPGTVIDSLPFVNYGSTACANHSFQHAVYDEGAPDLFYSYTSEHCEDVTVSLCGSSFDTAIEIRVGDSCPGDSVVALNNDLCGSQSQLTFTALANQTYFIVVEGYGDASGSFVLNITGTPHIPANDNCPGTSIISLPFHATGCTEFADNSTTHCIGGVSPDVVYNYMPSVAQLVTVSLIGSSFDTGVEVRESDGGPCGTSVIACNDDYFGPQSQVTFPAFAFLTYYIIVQGQNGAAGNYELSVTNEPYPCIPDTIVSAPTTIVETTCDLIDRCTFSQGRDFIAQVNIDHSGSYTFSMCDTMGQGVNFDSYMSLSTACCGGTILAQNDNGCGYPGRSRISCLWLNAGTYYVTIEPVHPFIFCGNFVLDLSECPGEDCATAPTIPSLPYCTTGSTAGFAQNYLNYNSCVPPEQRLAPDVVYKYTPPVNQVISASLCGSQFNTLLSVWHGCPSSGGVLIACNDDFCTLQSCCQGVSLTANQTYYFIIGGRTGQSGNFSFQVTTGSICPGQCDPCPFPNLDSEAINNNCVAPNPLLACGDTVCGQINNFFGDGGDLYRFQIGGSDCQVVTIDVFGNDTPGQFPFHRGLDPSVQLFRDSCSGSIALDHFGGFGNDARLISPCLEAGTYRVAVFPTTQPDSGRYVLSIACQDCPCFCPPDAPDSLVIQPMATPGMIRLQWASVTMDSCDRPIVIDRYVVYRALSMDAAWDSIGVPSPPNLTVFVDSAATVDQAFYFVRAVKD